MDADVIVIGAGPVGSLAAREIAKQGFSVLILEEHKQVGRPVHCAGLVGISGLNGNGIRPDSQVVATEVQRSVFHAPSGSTLVFDKGKPHAYVLLRDRLDKQIVREAEAAGASLLLEHRVRRCICERSCIRVQVRSNATTQEFQAHVVVNAEGIGARLARQQGLSGLKSAYILPALQYELANVSLPTDTVHLFFDSQLAKHFFAWIIPLDSNHARIGLATAQRRPRQTLDKFLTKTPMVKGATIERRYGGLVYTGGPLRQTVVPRFITIGDAAGQTKATTGGGVVSGGGCAIIAAASIKRALYQGDLNHSKLAGHDRDWNRVWGRQLRLMVWLRLFANTLTNQELDHLFPALQGAEVRRLVESRGDIDQQGKLIISALRSPVLLKHFLRLGIAKLRYFPALFRFLAG